ncbi:GNAT family N-acetyltransferase [Metasolibacillus sp. FSL K6-0083]|uniref:GNAT family N-acetyltransferase n=1 Tax=Metasolibacillus sp. FSL K6-0083 TaxID=2921416 RepID=UPI00315B206C
MDLLLLADPSETSIEKYIHKSKVFVAVEDGLVVGVYALMEKAPGKALVQHAIKSARLLGMESIEIGTGNSSIQQLALYQKCGFRLKEIIHDYFIDNYDEPIFENGIQCRDMVRLQISLN